MGDNHRIRQGILIGKYRSYYQSLGYEGFDQNSFIRYKKMNLCSQSTLSRLENGLTVSSEEILLNLIEKIGLKYCDDSRVFYSVNRFATRYLKMMTTSSYDDLVKFRDKIEHLSKVYESTFYLGQVIDVIRVALEYLLNSKLPDIFWLEKNIHFSKSFSSELRTILLDLAIWYQEISPRSSTHIESYISSGIHKESLTTQSLLIELNLQIREGDFYRAIRLLDKLLKVNLNEISKFRLHRLELMLKVNLTKFEKSSDEVQVCDFTGNMVFIPKQEMAKYYNFLGISEIYCDHYHSAKNYFLLAQECFEQICVIQLPFLYEVSLHVKEFSIVNQLDKIRYFVKDYGTYHNHVFRYFELLTTQEDSSSSLAYLAKHLKTEVLKTNKKIIPQSIFVRSAIDSVSRNGKYKYIFDLLY